MQTRFKFGVLVPQAPGTAIGPAYEMAKSLASLASEPAALAALKRQGEIVLEYELYVPDNRGTDQSAEQPDLGGSVADADAASPEVPLRVHVVRLPEQNTSGVPMVSTLNRLALEAVRSGCDFLLPVVDTIALETRDWATRALLHFSKIERKLRNTAPFGFGSVSFDNGGLVCPGPTIVHRSHVDIFGHLLPDGFRVEHLPDAGWFLYEIYRRWGASVWAHDMRVTYSQPSAAVRRFRADEPDPARSWKFELLATAVDQGERWLRARAARARAGPHAGAGVADEARIAEEEEEEQSAGSDADDGRMPPRYFVRRCWSEHRAAPERSVLMRSVSGIVCLGDVCARVQVVDVVVPSYRCDLDLLRGIVGLRIPSRTSTRFYIVIDNPSDSRVPQLEETLRAAVGDRHRLLVLVNEQNMGASASRNRGLDASAADWICFIDDDVRPDPNLLAEYRACVQRWADPRRRTRAEIEQLAGFIGLCAFPESPHLFANACRMAETTTLFYYVAEMVKHPPWGVTANILARNDRTRFDLSYARTGGGEDTQYGLAHPGRWISAPEARVEHPWWVGGRRCYGHFYRWSLGDALQLSKNPQHTHRTAFDYSESVVLLTVLAAVLLPLALLTRGFSAALSVLTWWLLSGAWLTLVEFSLDTLRHFANYERQAHLHGTKRLLAALEGTLVKNAQHFGRTIWNLRLGALRNLGLRFDMWAGTAPSRLWQMKLWQWTRFALFTVGVAAITRLFL